MIKKFIRASAGTGKTHTLLNTIFQYDSETKKPTVSYQRACDEINKSVFLTFSNSAAEEIRSRIYKGLAQCEGRPETDLLHALAQQDVRIRVYTIHSFALEMLRLFRYKLCLPAELSFADEDEPLWEYCVKEFFAKNWNQKALRELLNIADTDKTQQALLDVFFFLSDRKNIQNFIEKKGDTLYFLSAMGKSFCADVPHNLAQLKTLLKSKLEIDVDGEYSEHLLQVRNRLAEVKDRELYKKSISERKTEIAKKEAALNDSLEKQKNGERLGQKDTENLANLPDEIAKLKQELAQYPKDVSFLENLCPVLDNCSYFLEQIIFAVGAQLYMPHMMSKGVFDFDAVVFLFIKELLRGNIGDTAEHQSAGVNAFLKELDAEGQSFSRLYVDEAQDNDIIQNYLAVLFGQGKCPVEVYVVGDLKQSIYTWRSAYPREFEEMMKECAQKPDITETLRTSYRIKAANTCSAINNICTAAHGKCAEWWYDPANDDLKLPSAIPQTTAGNVQMWGIKQGKILSLPQKGSPEGVPLAEGEKPIPTLEDLDAFFQTGRTAVVVRKRSALSQVPDLKEKLKQANFKLDNSIYEGESGQAKSETLQPELEILMVLFMALTGERVLQVPFTLFWSDAGNLITEKLQLSAAEKMPEDFKDIFEKIYKDIAHDLPGNRVERVLGLFDKYNLWTHLCHTDLTEEEKNPQELRRTFYHILMRAQLVEDKYNRRSENAFYDDPVWSVIRKGKIVRSCYSIPDYAVTKSGQTKPAPDVLTIHTSKGLTYDNMIVVAEFKDDFFGNTEDFGMFKYMDVYKHLFSVDFQDVLGEEPKMEITYFPYLGLIPANLLKRKDIDTASGFWAKASKSYNNIKNLNRSEQLNLLYVALTRTAKNLLLLDLSPLLDSKGNVFEDTKAERDLFEQAGVEVLDADGEKKEKESALPPVKYEYQEVPFEPMDIGGAMKTRSVRSEITGKIYRKYGGGLSCLARFNHAKKGSMVHNIMQRLIGQASNAADFIIKAEQLQQNTPPANTLYAQAVQLVAANGEVIKNNEDLLLGKYTFHHEVPVWQFNEESGTLTKGSIDTLAVGAEKAVIVEYKVVFGHSQKAQAEEQMERYEHMLRALERDYSIEKRAVELKE